MILKDVGALIWILLYFTGNLLVPYFKITGLHFILDKYILVN